MSEAEQPKKKIAILAAGSYMAGPIAHHLHKNGGYVIVAIVRESTDTSAIEDFTDDIRRGDLSDLEFMKSATKGCFAIVNFLNQLMPPKETIKEQLENDLPPIQCALQAALEHDCIFVHTSGNFSIPTAGKDSIDGGIIKAELPDKPVGADLLDVESWSTFQHEGGMVAVSTLAEAKHRQDHAIQDFVKENPSSKARVIIPAGVYGPSVGTKFSFWDLAAHLYLIGQFGDFGHAFIHINDACVVYQAVIEQGEAGCRYPMYGESMTVRTFVEKYAKICSVAMNEDGPVCSEEESKRVYDDSETREKFGIDYKYTIDNSLSDTIENLKERNLLMVKEV